MRESSASTGADWIVASGNTWLPALDDVTLALASAQKALSNGDRPGAAAQIDAANEALKGMDQGEPASAPVRARIARLLSQTAKALRSTDPPARAEVNALIEQAARADLQERWVLDAERAWLPYAERPADELRWARQYLAAGERAVAGRHAAKAAALLEMLAVRPGSSLRTRFQETAQRLLLLSRAMEDPEALDLEKLDMTFASVEQLLATYHIERSVALSVRDSGSPETRQNLYLSAKYLSTLALRRRADLGPQAKEVLTEMTGLTTTIEGNRRLSREQVLEAIDKLRATLRALGPNATSR